MTKPAALAPCSLSQLPPYPFPPPRSAQRLPNLAPPRRSPCAAASSPPRPTPSSSSPPAAPLPPPLLFILIALLLVFTAFAFVVSGRGYREYRLGEYFTWLQRRVEDADNWARIRSCLRDGSVARFAPESLQQFVTNNLSPIQMQNGNLAFVA
ncbi:hypothetical protein ZWY2020_056952 [Hordeum vulgare]|nr:hypothetical protein ZWY2020_056952 [Hordeum vulgare]